MANTQLWINSYASFISIIVAYVKYYIEKEKTTSVNLSSNSANAALLAPRKDASRALPHKRLQHAKMQHESSKNIRMNSLKFV